MVLQVLGLLAFNQELEVQNQEPVLYPNVENTGNNVERSIKCNVLENVQEFTVKVIKPQQLWLFYRKLPFFSVDTVYAHMK